MILSRAGARFTLACASVGKSIEHEREKRYNRCMQTAERPHGNRKYQYPVVKSCKQCGGPFDCNTKEQVNRNRFCGPCVVARRRMPKGPQATDMKIARGTAVKIACAVCGVEVVRNAKHAARVTRPVCSYECNGKLRGLELVKHSHKGRGGWTESSYESYKTNMSGAKNPSWKGGVTLKRPHGNYSGVTYVRCPNEYRAMARKDGYVMAHRLAVAQAIGRVLSRTEVVHHIDHNPRNNETSNLMLFANNADHKRYEGTGTPAPLWNGMTAKPSCGR